MREFNLVTSPWVLLDNGDEISLRDLFSQNRENFLGGNPIEIISMFKLLLAIGQAACTLKRKDYVNLTNEQLTEKVLAYLDKFHDSFYLYDDEKPFLQMPSIKHAKVATFNALSFGKNDPITNSTVINHSQIFSNFSTNDTPAIARLLVQQMGFALGGKKVDDKVCLAKGYVKKSTAPVGSSLLAYGALHSFFKTSGFLDTIRLNLFTEEQIADIAQYEFGFGTPVWERMPSTENCEVANELKGSYFGRLVPVNRFCLINAERTGFHYVEGVQHLGYADGMYDPTVTFRMPIKNSKGKIETLVKKNTVIFARTTKAVWRSLPSLLSFTSNSQSNGDLNIQLRNGRINADFLGISDVSLVACGLQLAISTGESVIGGKDDFVYSEFSFDLACIGETFYSNLIVFFEEIEKNAKYLYICTKRYYENIGNKNCDALVERVTQNYWQKIEPIVLNALLDFENIGLKEKKLLQKAVVDSYSALMSSTARQLASFAKNHPRLKKEEVVNVA